ncbi:MAG: SRPBCC family protein [SAR324 cluster bacterium]|nr:SRPBCC family protein [SAR324 cluster bacterium]
MKVTKQITIEATAEKVWQIFAHDFDNAHLWMSSVPSSYGEKVGDHQEGSVSAGRVCELNGDPNGLKASESFLAFDEETKTCTVQVDLVNAPFILPIYKNILDFSVTDIGLDTGAPQALVTWEVTPHLKPLANLVAPLVKFGLGLLMSQITEELKFFAENGTPHPRKLKSISNLEPATNE